ncbi:thioredoxin-like protein [Mytilinidion resinicola]|uniref:Thioredoxin-like protein n=1 Tax=Mytilinidion resinicola TaxID=574789 RepID=A0A6A6YBV4_9PEZI|nr:thioredoxin-like protein [Mytilinidion resinicola]KAF2806190.1 thioredoxin-like protein [Mytilinidion resinicola]
MAALAKVRIGEHAPDFVCDAVLAGQFREISLSYYKSNRQWLLLMFIPATFSFVCPSEVLAFQNTLDEFTDRNCAAAFVSVDTKHSLWHWQSLPPRFGGLGKIDLPLLADPSHKMSKDYGCLIEDEGLIFITDPSGIITVNNLAVGRSVLEALRLVEAFQAVMIHGVLCPANWAIGADTIKDDYDERFARLQAEFGDIEVADLDAKHGLSRTVSNSSGQSHRGTPSVRSPLSASRIPSGNGSWANVQPARHTCEGVPAFAGTGQSTVADGEWEPDFAASEGEVGDPGVAGQCSSSSRPPTARGAGRDEAAADV